MPHQLGIPFSRGSHTSFKAASRQVARRGTKTRLYLRVLFERGALTDHEAHAEMSKTTIVAHTGIQSIRAVVIDAGLVRRGREERQSPYGEACSTWELTEAGRKAVAEMTGAAA